MEKTSDKRFRIVSWPWNGMVATGVVDRTGFVIIAVNYKMDSNIEEGDTWVADTLYTGDVRKSPWDEDWSLVREATIEEKLKLLDALALDEVLSFELQNER